MQGRQGLKYSFIIIYIYITEIFETPTIFHISTILKNNNNNKTFSKPEPNALPSTSIFFFFFILGFLKSEPKALPSTTTFVFFFILGFIPFLSFAVLSSLCLSQFSKPLNHIPWALSHSFSGKKCQPPTTIIYCQSRYPCRYFNFCYLRFRYLDLV